MNLSRTPDTDPEFKL